MTGPDDRRPPAMGAVPLPARWEHWMEAVLDDVDRCADLVAVHGSPLNLLDFSPLGLHAEELLSAATERGVAARVFVARKANKAVGLVDAASRKGLGVDVASLGELQQCLSAGMRGEDLIVSAAVKSRALLEVAVTAGAAVSLDNQDEAGLVEAVASAIGIPARVAVRLAVVAPGVPPSRFGMPSRRWLELVRGFDPALLALEGIHFHLNGYSAAERSVALRQACVLADRLAELGRPVSYVDMGGGVPMSYLRSGKDWSAFWRALETDVDGYLTWRGDRLGLVDPRDPRPSPDLYPYWQDPVRGEWLGRVLDDADGDGVPVSRHLTERGLVLHLEPGRAVLDGCGMTLAEVAFRKESSDGVGLVGLHMNRTQVRSTSADFLLDPAWLRPSRAGTPSAAMSAYLVGAYCIEEEVLLRRRLEFPAGVAVGDLAVFPNTAGYLMHIVESASHQLPLARNLVHLNNEWVLDACDAD